jgi:putative salt-induced outer membrane protein
MSFHPKTTVMAAVTAFFITLSPAANAQISPDIMNLLIVASQKDNGANLDLVAGLAIAANPDAAAAINELVANLKKQMPKKKEVAVVKPAPIAQPAPAAVQKVVEDNPGFFSLRGWDGEVELNYLRSSGNTQQESMGLAGKLKRETDQFHHVISTYFDLNKNTGVTDKQRWGISYKLDYDFSEKIYLTGFAGYENDQFGAFRERITTALGIGYPIISTDSYSWKIEGGPSILFTRDLPGESYNTSFNAFASSLFDWTINDRSNLSNATVFYFGSKNVIESKTALKVKINGALSSKFSYDIKFDKDAPLGRKKTDTVARAGLLYDF